MFSKYFTYWDWTEKPWKSTLVEVLSENAPEVLEALAASLWTGTGEEETWRVTSETTVWIGTVETTVWTSWTFY